MVIKIEDLDWNSNYDSMAYQMNESVKAENIRELTEQEQKILGGGTGTFSLTVTDEDGTKVIDEKTTLKTGSIFVNGNLDVLEEESEVKFIKTRPIAIYYPSIIGFGYFFGDDSEDSETDA